MIPAELREAFQFHHAHGAYVVGERAVCAWIHARAELLAKAFSLRVVWEDEDEPWDGEGCPAPPIVVWGAVYEADQARGVPLASLGMVGLTSWQDDYKRVVEAELFAEALAELDARAVREREACEQAREREDAAWAETLP